MIGICTVVYNKLYFVKSTVEAVLENTTPPYVYVLVFNDSPYPGVKEYVESLQPQRIKIIENPSNYGVTKAYKQGLDWLKYQHFAWTPAPWKVKYFAKIDDDTIIQTKGWNEKMLEPFKYYKNLGILSANIDSGKQTGPFKKLFPAASNPDFHFSLEVFNNPCVGG